METRTNRKKKKTSKKKKWKRVVLLTFFALFILSGLFVYNIYGDVASAVDKMTTSLDREKSDKREEIVEFDEKDPVSILLVGVDEREDDAGRTDSMLVLTVNPELNSTKILSIPRDTRAELTDKKNSKRDRIDKMNHAYAYGGIEMTMDSIEHFLNIPLDYYVKVNMQGFEDIVDAVGGIDVYNEYAFELDGTYLSKGEHHLDGEEALQYARMRKEDPAGDVGRQERQREVISKVIKKGASLSTLTNYDEVLEALSDNIETNLTLQEIISMQKDYRAAADNIEKLNIEGADQYIDDIYYYMVEDKTRQLLSDELREHLGLRTEKLSASKARAELNS
ncbi:LCP family glycopolymer transferase [Bacillus tuaregi]|uniref:LCP family glycopolymer transferase n=1 Tax=Bacillus tuaregi TaxID=1816695 RepID=UPI0008F8F88C|nr:LCP family protein [Bacillus tuaregi]